VGAGDLPVVVPALEVEAWPPWMLIGYNDLKAVLLQLTTLLTRRCGAVLEWMGLLLGGHFDPLPLARCRGCIS
jgi:hypothetical protein